MENIYERIAALRIVPVIAIEDVAAALPLADALAEGGLPVAEITFRTDAAAAVIERIARERPAVLVGAGTILTTDNLMRAVECRSAFDSTHQVVGRQDRSRAHQHFRALPGDPLDDRGRRVGPECDLRDRQATFRTRRYAECRSAFDSTHQVVG